MSRIVQFRAIDSPSARTQRGGFLLESLIAILIVAFGILGLVGLQARAIQHIDDAQFRSEAVFLTNAYVAQMWTANQATLVAEFKDCTACAGTPYDEFKNVVYQRLPGAAAVSAPNPKVDVAALTNGSWTVTITVSWLPPGETVAHNFQQVATIGWNNP